MRGVNAQNNNGFLDTLEWEDSLYEVFAYSAVRCSGSKHEALRELLEELYSRWAEEDGFDPKTSKVSQQRYQEFYHSIRTGVLWPRGLMQQVAKSASARDLAEVLTDRSVVERVRSGGIEVHAALTNDLFHFTDRALGLQRAEQATIGREVLTGLALGCFPLAAYPFIVYRRQAEFVRVLHTWMSSSRLPQVLMKLRLKIAAHTVLMTVLWALCLAPIVLRFGTDTELRVSLYVPATALHCISGADAPRVPERVPV